ncbi:MAG: SRPBCC family protein [Jatrophihabitans sp.]
MAIESRHLSIFITRPPAEVYGYAANPAHLPLWAAGLATGIEQLEGRWVSQSPMGTVVVEFAPANEYGVLDHQVMLPSGQSFYNPMRVIADSGGSEVIFTSRREEGTEPADYERDCVMIAEDLQSLKRVLEN